MTKINACDIKKFKQKLMRRVNSTLFFDDESFALLSGKELKTFPKLLFPLYLFYKKEQYNPRMPGMSQKDITKQVQLNSSTVIANLWKLNRVLLNVASYKPPNGKYYTRYWRLTPLGFDICKEWFEPKEEDKKDELPRDNNETTEA